WSKWAAEEALLDGAARLPVHVFRLPTVIADDPSGQAGQRNAFHNTVRLLHHGLLSALPGRGATPVYLVTADQVADAIVTLLRRRPRPGGQVWHVCPRRSETLRLDDLVGAAFAAFEETASFRRRRLLRPLYLDEPG